MSSQFYYNVGTKNNNRIARVHKTVVKHLTVMTNKPTKSNQQN